MARAAVLNALVAILAFAGIAQAQSVDAPASLADPTSPRLSAMGYTGSGLADGYTEVGAVWMNPALVAFDDYHHDRPDATFFMDPQVGQANSDFYHGAFGWSAGEWSISAEGRPARIFFSFTFTKGDTTFVENNLGEVTSAFEPNQQVYAGGIAQQTTENFSWGLTAKIVNVDLNNLVPIASDFKTSDTAFLLDAGFVYGEPESKVTWGAVIRNLGSKLALGREEDTVRSSLRGGVAINAVADPRHDLTLTGDLALQLSDIADGPLILFGAEYIFAGILAGRIGYIYEGWYTDVNPVNEFTGGIGIGYRRFRLDYGYVPDEGGHKSQFALQFRFGG